METPEKHSWKKKIALDIDGTLWDLYTPFFKFYNNKFGTDFSITDFDHDLVDVLGVTQKELTKLFDEFENSEYAEDLPIYEDVNDILFELSQTHYLMCVTAKGAAHRDSVLKRLKSKFPKFDFPIYFSGDYVGAGGGKDKICLDIGAEIIIEDSPQNALSCAKVGIKAILLDRSWNRGIDDENMIRAKNWKEVLEIIDN